MRSRHLFTHRVSAASLATLLALALGGCGGDSTVELRSQAITFLIAPRPAADSTTATVRATASSGLPVRYGSRTPSICAVDATSGLVTATATGTCTVSADQDGDATFAAAPQATQGVPFSFGVITFGPAPSMAAFDLETVTAMQSAGAPVSFTTTTPSVCSIDGASGLVTALAAGSCAVVARAGPLSRATLDIAISAPTGSSVPGVPSGAAASAGTGPGTAQVRLDAVRSGGNPITSFTVTSDPPGAEGSGSTLPVQVTCPSSCLGYRFAIAAGSAAGQGAASGRVSVVTQYQVIATIKEPATRPRDSIFVGTFTHDATVGEVTGLAGRLSESMTGGSTAYPNDTMIWLPITHQLSSLPVTIDGADGWLVTSFKNDSTDTFTTRADLDGTDGWSPGTGRAQYYGYPGPNPGNAYIRIFVNAADPTATPTQGQIDKMAYADCAPGGMMGTTCMTGTTVAGYGSIGTMGGYPVSQVTTRR